MIRDIIQLRESPPFGVTAVQSYLTVEAELQVGLRYVPYCNEHRNVWSSHFTRIILDAASQIDSLWKATSAWQDSSAANKKLTIADHHSRFQGLVAHQQVVFFAGSVPSTLTPFNAWEAGTYASLDWWKAYNDLKHDRYSHQTQSTLEHAVQAVAGLLIAVIYSGACDLALLSANLLDTSSHNPWAYTASGLLRDVTFDAWSKFETALFAHPLGIFGVSDCNLSNHWPSASVRFNTWWALNADQFTRPRQPSQGAK